MLILFILVIDYLMPIKNYSMHLITVISTLNATPNPLASCSMHMQNTYPQSDYQLHILKPYFVQHTNIHSYIHLSEPHGK